MHETLDTSFLRLDISHEFIPLAWALHEESVALMSQGVGPFNAALDAGVSLGLLSK
jgi:hypothetical protein